jgi:hypothetical protein
MNEKTINSNYAIWYPLFPVIIPGLALLMCMVTIAYTGFILAGVDGGNSIHVFDWILDVASMTSRSKIPLATAMTYGIALMAAPVVTIIACFTRVPDIRPFRNFWRSRSSISCFFGWSCYAFVVIAPYVFITKPSHYSWTSHFFDAMKSNLFLIILWGESIFLAHFISMLMLMMGFRVFFDSLIRGIKCLTYRNNCS